MTKYIENRINKIKALSDILNSHNVHINNAINLIQPLCNNDITISILTNSMKNNNSIYYNIFSLKFLIDHNNFSYFSVRNEFSFGKEDISFKHLCFVTNFLNKLNNLVDLEELFSHTKEAIKTFKKIETLYKEIDLKSSGFKEKSFLLINSIKENFPIPSNCNIDNGLFFNLKNNHSRKSISFQPIKKIKDIKNGIYLEIPNLDKYNLKAIKFSEENLSDYFEEIEYKSNLIKQEFFDLNKYFFNYIHLTIESISLDIYPRSNLKLFIADLKISIKYLTEEQISIIVDKINLNKTISNF